MKLILYLFFQEQKEVIRTSVTIVLYNRQSPFMDQIQPVYRAGVLTKCAWKRAGCLMDLCLGLLHLDILFLCCHQRCYFRLPGFYSTTWAEHFVLKPVWEVTNRRIELPVYFKYYADKDKISGHLPKPWVISSAWPWASCRALSGRGTAASQAAAARSHISGWSRAAVLALCLCYHGGEVPRVRRRTCLCSTYAGVS